MKEIIEKKDLRNQIYTKRADNVRIVSHPVAGTVYVCPFPPTHFDDLRQEAMRLELGELKRPLSLSS